MHNKINHRYIPALPNPKNLIYALRDIGYSLETAIADIIDNSIAANATEIQIIAHFDTHESYLAVIDNGEGMDESTLNKAMQLGSLDPVLSRNKGDLGRFGLGLKTASFSQAGKLIVVSRKNQKDTGRCWDLEHVSKSEKWEIEILNEYEINNIPEYKLLNNFGTLVLWKDLYRLVDTQSKRNPEEIFWEKIDEAREHLGLVFHRYLSGEAGLKRLSIYINGDSIAPFDPFEGAGKHFPEETIGKIKIQAYLLPHLNKTTPEQYKRLAGRDGYVKSQGFYVYRNSRLMIHGTWFNLSKQSEATKLARVKIDLPNSEDFAWSIDVKKSRATPPESIRAELKRTIERITASSTRVYKSRGARISRLGYVPIWSEYHQHNQKSFRINYKNPLIASLLSSLDEETQKKVKEILSITESTLPLDTIFVDLATEPENVRQDSVTEEQLNEHARRYWDLMYSMGYDKTEILEKFRQTEPFSKYEDFCETYIKREGMRDGSN
ncbi:MAG: ATP-binding protein [Sulfurovaceae bacterium]